MDFSSLKLSREMVDTLNQMGYTSMTPVQKEALPLILDGRDVIVKAKTGSGKTAAFGIGVLEALDVKKFRIQSIILCPTRELATQVSKELRNIAKFRHNIKILQLIGGESFGKQVGSLQHQAHIIVGTPGRILKHLNKKTLSLEDIKTLVLDEADRMLDMGFLEEVEEILSHAPKQRQTLLFSATYTPEVLEISKQFQNDAVMVEVEEAQESVTCTQVAFVTQDKERVLEHIFMHYDVDNCIVFVNTKVKADTLAEFLRSKNIDALALHGDMEQYERNDVLIQFSNASLRVLVATDVAARGLDIEELSMVINFDMPTTPEVYTHRIGRTARAGREGIAVTLAEDAQEVPASCSVVAVHTLQEKEDFALEPLYRTLVIEGGKKDKLRAGDIVGALSANGIVKAEDIGNIDVYERQTYVAIKKEHAETAYMYLKKNTIKKKKFSIWVIE